MNTIVRIDSIVCTKDINGYIHNVVTASCADIRRVILYVPIEVPIVEGDKLSIYTQFITSAPEELPLLEDSNPDYAIRVEYPEKVNSSTPVSRHWDVKCSGQFIPSKKGYPKLVGPSQKPFYAGTVMFFDEYGQPLLVLAVGHCSAAKAMAKYVEPTKLKFTLSLMRESKNNRLMLNLHELKEEY